LDKPLIEPVAIRLGAIFGQNQVFYDSWSIKPGDGIIDQMNKGLEAPEFVFFFVSANSLNSGMVKLDGKTRSTQLLSPPLPTAQSTSPSVPLI